MIVLYRLRAVIALVVLRIMCSPGLTVVPFEAMTTQRPSSMLTLTYNDSHLPADKSVSQIDTTLFNKRLRYYLDYYGKRKVKMYWTSEYGEVDFRPHYHYMIFGLDSNKAFDMECVHRAWSDRKKDSIGFWDLKPLVPGRIRYVMKYVQKEFSPDWQDEFEKRRLKPLFHSCSNGIGFDWFMQNLELIREHNGYYVNGQLRPLNRYYEDLFKMIKDTNLYEKYEPMIKRLALYGNDYRLSTSLPLMKSEHEFSNNVREYFMKHKEFLDYVT